jgi:hypothetical protein
MDRGRPDRKRHVALVFVHPGAAGPRTSEPNTGAGRLGSTWAGLLVVLQDMEPFSIIGTGATLLAALDATIAVG